MSEIIDMEERLKNCGREFCIDIPDCDCGHCQLRLSEQDELLQSEIDKIIVGYHTDANLAVANKIPHYPSIVDTRNLILAKIKQRYEQKRLDRPDREKIARVIYKEKYSIGVDDTFEKAYKRHQDECYILTDDILALIPDEKPTLPPEILEATIQIRCEEAKKQERERITKIILKVAKDREVNFGSQRGWVSDIRQALQGEV